MSPYCFLNPTGAQAVVSDGQANAKDVFFFTDSSSVLKYGNLEPFLLWSFSHQIFNGNNLECLAQHRAIQLELTSSRVYYMQHLSEFDRYRLS